MAPFPALALLALLAAQEPGELAGRVEGLRAGERVLPSAALDARLVRGRLFDASEGRPVAGALVEAWTEADAREGVLVDRATTGADGGFALARREGAHEAAKLLVRSAAHRATVRALDALGEPILLVPRPAPVGLRVVDLDGRPIAGARLRTHQTCAHAPAAVEALSDALGVLLVEDFPPLADWPEAQLEAEGHAARCALEPELLACADRGRLDALPTLRLARRAPLALRLLDGDGRPLARARVTIGAEPCRLDARSDAEGRVRFGSLPDGLSLLVRAGEGADRRLIEEVPAWSGAAPAFAEELVLRTDAAGVHGGGLDDALLAIELVEAGAEGDSRPLLFVLHERGLVVSEPGEHALPPGRVRLLLGAPFSGWAPWSGELVLEPSELRTLRLRPRREPELVLELPGEERWSVLVGTKAASTRVTASGTLRLSVPPDEALVVVAEGEREVRRWRVPAASASRALAFAEGERLEEGPAAGSDPAPGARARVRLRLPDHARGAALEVHAAGELLRGTEEELALPAGAPFEAWIRAQGCVPLCVCGVAPGAGELLELDCAPVRCATLVLRGPLVRACAGGVEAERVQEGGAEHGVALRLAGLAPGPLTLALEREDGAPISLELVLEPGETRTLAVR